MCRWRRTARGGHQTISDHQQAVVLPRQIALDDHFLADFARSLVCSKHLFAAAQIDSDALALVAVTRLDHNRTVQFAGHAPCIFCAAHYAPFGNRDAGIQQKRLGEFLVLGNRFGNDAGAIAFRRLDAALAITPSERGRCCLRSGAERNAALNGCVDEWRRCWARDGDLHPVRAAAPLRCCSRTANLPVQPGTSHAPARKPIGRRPPRSTGQ